MPLNSDPPLGFLAPFKGFRHILKTPALWQSAIAPFIVSLLIYALAFAGYVYAEWKLIAWMSSWFNPGFWGTVFKWLSILATLLAGGFLALGVALAANEGINGFFLSRLVRKTEILLGVADGELQDLSMTAELIDSIKDMAALVGVNLLLLLIGFIPVVGALAAIPLGLYFNSFKIGVEYLEMPMTLRGKRRDEIVAFARIHSHHTLGLGIVMLLTGFIPLLNGLLAPAAAVGGVFLYRDLRNSAVDVPSTEKNV